MARWLTWAAFLCKPLGSRYIVSGGGCGSKIRKNWKLSAQVCMIWKTWDTFLLCPSPPGYITHHGLRRYSITKWVLVPIMKLWLTEIYILYKRRICFRSGSQSTPWSVKCSGLVLLWICVETGAIIQHQFSNVRLWSHFSTDGFHFALQDRSSSHSRTERGRIKTLLPSW